MQPSTKVINFLFSKFFLITFLVIIGIFTLLTTAFIGFYSFQFNKGEVQKIISRMYEDIRYKNGEWDLYYLNSDPLLPGGESHYIITSDGYVIDRWRPISGYLDTSNLEYILQFESPKTFTTPTKEQWRMLSRPIKNGNETIGAILVSKFIAEEDDMDIIDKRLRNDLNFVINKTKVNGEKIDLSKLDIRETQYDISIKIIDKYNTIIAKTNNSNSIDRAPNYIDSSYISKELKSNKTKIIFDEVTKEPFLVLVSPFKSQNETVGIIIVGRSLAFLLSLLEIFISSVALLVLGITLIWFIYYKKIHAIISHEIRFDSEKGFIYVNHDKIEIPLNSHQYHLSLALFKNPKEPKSAEEITSQFGETEGNIWRRVYDAMLIVNKKVEPYLGYKLIVIKNKKFTINPDLRSIIHNS